MPLPITDTDRRILPFNPPGTFPPGTFPPGAYIHGEAPVVAPSYPLRPPEPSYSPTTSTPPPDYTMKALPPISSNLGTGTCNLDDTLYRKLSESEALVRTLPNAAELHTEAVQSALSTLAAQEQEAEDQETKIAVRKIAERYRAEVNPSVQRAGPQPGPLTGMLRALAGAEAEEPNENIRLIIASFAEGYREEQMEMLGMDINSAPAPAPVQAPFQAIDLQTQSDNLFQELSRKESLLASNPYAESLYAKAEMSQHMTLAELGAAMGDEASKIAIRIITEGYKEKMESTHPRPGPYTTMLVVLARAEASEQNELVKSRINIAANRFKGGYREMCASASATANLGAQQALQPMQPAVVAQPRHVSMPTGNASGDPLYGVMQTPMHPLSPSWSSGSTAVADQPNKSYTQSLYSPSLQSPSIHSSIQAQQASYLPPQPNFVSVPAPPSPIAKENTLSENPGAPVPPLARQPKARYIAGGTITSKDPLLNTDGDALYRYILDNSGPPTFRLHCYGSHTETDIRASGNKVETVKRTIVDFDFVIDLALSIRLGPGDLYVLDDNTPAYRGRMELEAGGGSMPRTVHEWARHYAASPKQGKEFRFRKAVIGLDRARAIDGINQIINSTGHSTYRNVYFSTTHSVIKVRIDSPLMTMLKHDCISCLLWLVLAWPIIWLIRRFGQEGGKWDVCRAAYVCNRDPRDPPGSAEGIPLGDGDWVKVWERTLRLAVGNRIQTSSPIYRPTANDSGVILFD